MKYPGNIKRRRKELHMTQTDLAKAVGYTSDSTISRIERGQIDLSTTMLQTIADALHTTSISLIYGDGSPDYEPSSLPPEAAVELNEDISSIAPNALAVEKKRLPLIGEIACGSPIYADEDWQGWIEVDADLDADFCVRAQGDSMIGDRIFDGDIVFIHKQPMVENGEIAAVLIGDNATLKRVSYDKDAGILQLFPSNPTKPIQTYRGEELNSIRILGKAVRCQFDLNNKILDDY